MTGDMMGSEADGISVCLQEVRDTSRHKHVNGVGPGELMRIRQISTENNNSCTLTERWSQGLYIYYYFDPSVMLAQHNRVLSLEEIQSSPGV